MRIKKYASLFHDGDITKIKHANNKVELWMESAEVLPEWNEDNIALSKRKTITGKLYLEGIISVSENENPYRGKFKMKNSYDKANIYDFETNFRKISLHIWWVKYLPEYEESGMFRYEIEAEKIIWENIPTLFDEYWDSL